MYIWRVLLKRQIPVLSSKQSKHSLFAEWGRMETRVEERGRCLENQQLPLIGVAAAFLSLPTAPQSCVLKSSVQGKATISRNVDPALALMVSWPTHLLPTPLPAEPPPVLERVLGQQALGSTAGDEKLNTNVFARGLVAGLGWQIE